jgi:predicted translin family RNA/ssDNA-binding protein
MESENVYYEKTYLEIANALTPELRKRQDQRRIELRKGGVFGSETGAGEQYAYFKKVRKVEEAVSTAALFPPVRTKLKKG